MTVRSCPSVRRNAKGSSQIVLLRLEQNQGISAARNAAIARATSPLLACVNPEVLPDPDWVATCVDYLRAHPQVGGCYTRTVPDNTRGLLTRWRMRFQEPKFAQHTGPATLLMGMRCSFAERRLKPSVGWFSPAMSSLARLYLYLTKWTIIRAGRNVVKGRFSFLPIDMALWAYALWIATERTVKHIFPRH
jgi:GT2 family glycosyltransferase